MAKKIYDDDLDDFDDEDIFDDSWDEFEDDTNNTIDTNNCSNSVDNVCSFGNSADTDRADSVEKLDDMEQSVKFESNKKSDTILYDLDSIVMQNDSIVTQNDNNIKHDDSVQNNNIATPNNADTAQTKNDGQAKKYDIHNFDNPYELLLAIMEDKNVDLKTVILSEITDEYLEYIRQSSNIDLEQASEFLAVAATLLEIKVKALLPKPEEPKDDEFDPEKELLRKVEEYKLMKEAAEELHAIEDIDRFYKDPDESVNDYRYVLKQMNMDNLLNAFTKMMIKLQQKTTISKERKIEKDRFTVADKIFSIKVIMSEHEQMHFSEMFDDDYSKSEVISTFQAMLELMKIQFLKVQQSALFDDILLIKNPEFVEGQGEQTIDDYDE